MKTIEINDKQYRQYDIVTLETKEQTLLVKKISFNSSLDSTFINNHLYILSDEKPKAGEWYITSDNKLLQCEKVVMGLIYADGDYGRNKNSVRKVIATSDKNLKTIKERIGDNIQTQQLHQISKEFIEYYISKYNKGEKIDKILIEVDLIIGYCNCEHSEITDASQLMSADCKNEFNNCTESYYKIKIDQNNQVKFLM